VHAVVVWSACGGQAKALFVVLWMKSDLRFDVPRDLSNDLRPLALAGKQKTE